MRDDKVIVLEGVGKRYSLEARPWHRLWSQLSGRPDRGPQHHALRKVTFTVRRGEVLGVIGRNGAGKSTLLQVLSGVLPPSEGRCMVRGRVAALLELGAGFNLELTGRENVRLNGPLLGISSGEVEQAMDGIVEFAGIGEFIDQPVRSYSSGMFVRLAFALATSVAPDILIIDEALSVGDGAFAHRSFERIMAMKERGVTILFCSHSMFQVEAMCTRALWIEAGEVRFDGPAHQATVEYSQWLTRHEQGAGDSGLQATSYNSAQAALTQFDLELPPGVQALRSGEHDLAVQIGLRSEPAGPAPTLGVVINGGDGRPLTSAGNWLDGVPVQRNARGEASVRLVFPRLSLLKGRYSVSVFVLCDRSINIWAAAEHVCSFEVEQDHLEQGVVSLPRRWEMGPAS